MGSESKSSRIAFFHNLPSGGALKTLYQKIRILEQKGHRISLYTFSTAEKDFLPQPLASGGIFETPLSFSGLLKWRHYLEASKTCAEVINRSDADFVYVDKCRFLSAPAVLRFLKKPSLFYAHEPLGVKEYQLKALGMSERESAGHFANAYGNLSLAGKLQKLFSIPKRVWIKRQDRKNLLLATRVMTCSRFAKDWLKKVYDVDAAVGYQGVDYDFFTPDPQSRKKQQVLSVGRIEPRKGHDFIVEALALIDSTVRPGLVVVCDEVQKSTLKKLEIQAASNKVNLRVIYRPSQEGLRKLYQESRILLCAGVCEPFGLTPLEAMACRVPVIAVKEGGYQETVTHEKTGFLLERNPALWAPQITALLNDEPRCQQLGAAGRQDVDARWGWQSFVNEVESFAETVRKG